jgi:hypothetical protein
VGALDLPSEPEEVASAKRAGDSGADRPTAREMHDPEERGRVYEAMRARVSAETREEAGQQPEPGREPEAGQPADGTGRRGYWDQIPRFQRMWAEHKKDWRESRRPAPDRSADPAGSYRSDGGFYLNPERHAAAVAAIGRVCEAEPTISADVRRVEQENRCGARLEGFTRRLKGDDRLKEKVAEGLATIAPDARPEEILEQVPDAIRYTFCLKFETYTRDYYDIKERLEGLGYEMYQCKNWWEDAEYKGVNTRWVTGEGQRFEVQLHTEESFHAKQYVTHDAYERTRNPLTPDEERDDLEKFQQEVSSWIRIPEAAVEIPSFKKEGF